MSISVLLSVYHKENPVYLAESLKSLTRQTLRDFEVVLVEDGPLPESLRDVIASFKGRLPLRSVVLAENVGLARALNSGLQHCRYDLVARMDTDDIALPSRMEVQRNFMNANPDVAVCSSWIEERDETMGQVVFHKKMPVNHADIATFAKLRNPINHPSAMFRKDAVLAVNGYPELFPEDYALWSVMLQKGYRFANIPQVLLHMRTGTSFIQRRGIKFLKGELNLLRFQRRIGFLSRFEYYRNVTFRSALRLPPKFVRELIYRCAR